MRIDDFDFNGKRALIRVDFNVPYDHKLKTVSDDTRIRLAIPTIKKVLNDGGSVVLMSHMGRPKDKPEAEFSLKQILSCLSILLEKEVKFVDDCISDEAFLASKGLLNVYDLNSNISWSKNIVVVTYCFVGDQGFVDLKEFEILFILMNPSHLQTKYLHVFHSHHALDHDPT